jgi:hypothetical protein
MPGVYPLDLEETVGEGFFIFDSELKSEHDFRAYVQVSQRSASISRALCGFGRFTERG